VAGVVTKVGPAKKLRGTEGKIKVSPSINPFSSGSPIEAWPTAFPSPGIGRVSTAETPVPLAKGRFSQ
jgi:hypothetical protein